MQHHAVNVPDLTRQIHTVIVQKKINGDCTKISQKREWLPELVILTTGVRTQHEIGYLLEILLRYCVYNSLHVRPGGRSRTKSAD